MYKTTKFRTVRRNGRTYRVPINPTKGSRKRRLTKADRLAFSENAMLAEQTWEEMTPAERRRARGKNKRRNKKSWGFSGKSPRTRDR